MLKFQLIYSLMLNIKKIFIAFIATSVLVGFFGMTLQLHTQIASASHCPIQPQTGRPIPGCVESTVEDCPGEVKNNICIPEKANLGNDCATDEETCLTEANPIIRDIRFAINFLAAGVGVVVTLAIIIGGVRYMTAGSNTTQVQEARKMIMNALVGLVAFGLMYAFLQWLVPGGVFS